MKHKLLIIGAGAAGITAAITAKDYGVDTAIIELLNNNELYERYSDEAIKRVKDFEISTVIKEWENVID